MSMSTHVQGIIPPSEKFSKMLAIYNNCKEASVDIPDQVWEFFDGNPPDPKGVMVDLTEKKYIYVCKEFKNDNAQGYELDLTKIPSSIKMIRFTNSW